MINRISNLTLRQKILYSTLIILSATAVLSYLTGGLNHSSKISFQDPNCISDPESLISQGDISAEEFIQKISSSFCIESNLLTIIELKEVPEAKDGLYLSIPLSMGYESDYFDKNGDRLESDAQMVEPIAGLLKFLLLDQVGKPKTHKIDGNNVNFEPNPIVILFKTDNGIISATTYIPISYDGKGLILQ